MMLCLSLIISSALSANAAELGDEAELSANVRFSAEYMTSPYYTQLMQALAFSGDKTAMERTVDVAMSQVGYKNYSIEGMTADQARAEGNLWTGATLRNNSNITGNTEYTRWAQQYLAGYSGSEIYVDYDWCAIFASWCLYQAGYYDGDELKLYYYSYQAEPRMEQTFASWLASYNLDQRKVWYTSLANGKLDAYKGWNRAYNYDIDPYELPYKPGSLIFFSWDGTGKWFNHVGIVTGYDPVEHILNYVDGNADGMVKTHTVDLDYVRTLYSGRRLSYAECVMAVAAYDRATPPEQKTVTAGASELSWAKNSEVGLSFMTNTGSVKVELYEKNSKLAASLYSYSGDLRIYNGEVVVSANLMNRLSKGRHTLTFRFDDGDLTLSVLITDKRKGDADMDGAVSILDATAIQNYLAGKRSLTTTVARMADVDADGSVTVLDVTSIQRYLAGMSCPFGIDSVVS